MKLKTKRRILNYLIILPPILVIGVAGSLERDRLSIRQALIASIVCLVIWAAAVWKSGYWR